MKKRMSLLLCALLALSLGGCGGTSSGPGAPSGSASASPAPEPPSQTATPAPADSAAPSAEPTGEGKTLVAYFSWSGNTRQVAELIAGQTGGDLFEIATQTPYTDDYNTLLEVAQQEQSEGARPELNAQVDNWDSYDTVFVGYPNWWSDAPMAVYTFLESYDFTGKTLVPFNTSASGGFGRSLTGLADSAPGAEMAQGLALTESELEEAETRVADWLGELGMKE